MSRRWLIYAVLAAAVVFAAAFVWRARFDFELGYTFQAGNFHGWTFTPNDEWAAYWLHKAAALGHPRSQYMLGLLYSRGWGVRQNDRRALLWFTRAVNNGYVQAMFHLGWMYHKGDGVRQDTATGTRLLRAAAVRGKGEAALAVGGFYERGDGEPRDPVRALKWYLLAVRACRAQPQRFANRAYTAKAVAARDRLLGRLTPAQVRAARRLVAGAR